MKIVIVKNKNKGIAAWIEGIDVYTGNSCRIDLPGVQVAVALTKHLSMNQTSREDHDRGIKYTYSL